MASQAAPTQQAIYNLVHYLEFVNLPETARTLERESGLLFNVRHFEELFLEGFFEEAEKYFSGFTYIHENEFTNRIIFEIRKQKFLEALDIGDKLMAVSIALEEFTIFKRYNNNLMGEAMELVAMEDIRKHSMLWYYKDTDSGRLVSLNEIKYWMIQNPKLGGKLFRFMNPPTLVEKNDLPSLDLSLRLSSNWNY